MKLHNLSVIFVIIAIPLILITSYYISLQIDTINMQTAYNAKLLDSTKEAIDAFEINTVEWNANYSDTADSKRRDVMASINTFINSFANNLGVSGTSKESIMAYMPAIAYTLYDGYYIYSPANEKLALKDENGVGIVMTKTLYEKEKEKFTSYTYELDDEGKLMYQVADGKSGDGKYGENSFTLNQENAATEYDHILKPFAMYSEKVGDWVINYTLDNYITIYGTMEDADGTTEYVYKSGYLTDPEKIKGIESNSINNITFNGKKVEPEYLTENVVYKLNENSEPIKKEGFSYVYECEGNTKVYFDENGNPFVVNSNLIRTDLSENLKRYKKITIPQKKGSDMSYKELYQEIRTGEWYSRTDTGEFIKKDIDIETYAGVNNDKKLDYSAINYCVESYMITMFINKLSISSSGTGTCACGYDHGNSPLKIDSTNDPEDSDSDFCIHKRGIIKNAVESNLNQAITSYSRNNKGEYQLPKLTETDWDQILTNVSIITFIQNIPIGMKYYNNYAIATSTVNKEYVDPNEIYLSTIDDEYYHTPYCNKIIDDVYKGYRSIDYVQKSYTDADENTKNYFKHGNVSSSNQACYYCLVQSSLYEEEKEDSKEKAYYTALARERYVAKMTKLPAEAEAVYYINVSPYISDNGTEKQISDAKYTINGEEHTGNDTVQIKKDVNEYSIAAKFGNGTSLSDTDDIISQTLGTYDAPIQTVTSAKNDYSIYKSNADAKVSVSKYDEEGIYFYVSGDCSWTAGDSVNATEQVNYLGPDSNGYINIKLLYEKNYSGGGNSEYQISANAEINKDNKLTIVTNVGDISGYVRLRFTNTSASTNEEEQFYSEYIFNVKNEKNIYCKIENNYDWYNKDWTVEVLNVAGEIIGKTTTMEYYTIGDSNGLKGFSYAVNGKKEDGANDAEFKEGSITFAKTEGRTFKLRNDIDNVGEWLPIAGRFYDKNKEDGWSDVWFKGTFDGQEKTVSGISFKDDNDYTAYGLFGWVGEDAKISNVNVTYTNGQIGSRTYSGNANEFMVAVGGIAGYSDGAIENCKVSGATLGVVLSDGYFVLNGTQKVNENLTLCVRRYRSEYVQKGKLSHATVVLL
jgi:hypothetical protein